MKTLLLATTCLTLSCAASMAADMPKSAAPMAADTGTAATPAKATKGKHGKKSKKSTSAPATTK